MAWAFFIVVCPMIVCQGIGFMVFQSSTQERFTDSNDAFLHHYSILQA